MNSIFFVKFKEKTINFWHWLGRNRKKTLLFLIFIWLFGTFVYSGGLIDAPRALKRMIFSLGQEIKTDSLGHTNFLLLGIAGGNHDGQDLTDTIMIASMDHEKKIVSFLSVPRDLYFKTELTGGNRINALYEILKTQPNFDSGKALSYLKEKMGEKFGVEIHYFAKVNFKGFTELVDALGGIEIDVKETIYDPFYPKDGTIEYEPFYIEKGKKEVDGMTALKYVRSRKTTSDFDRSLRQQQVIEAIKNKALSLRTLTSPAKIKSLYEVLADNIETDLTLRNLINLGELADKYSDLKVVNNVLHDDQTRLGGILYVPPRESYNGMFVLLPLNNNFGIIERFTNLILYYPQIYVDPLSIQVLNGTKVAGRAQKVRDALFSMGFAVYRYGNASSLNVEKTKIYLRNKNANKEAVKYLADYLSAQVDENIPEVYLLPPYASKADIILEMGQDFSKLE